jgi:membrane protease YdiL (CAAX protease family)
MQLVDHVFILLLFVLQPIHGAFEARYYIARAKAGLPAERVRFYRQTTLLEWTFLALLAAAWYDFGRPFADLGFVMSIGPGFWIGFAVCTALTGFLLYSWRSVKNASVAEKARHAESFGNLVSFIPHTRRELHNFYAVSITAGIVEEIVYRGFVLWYLGQYMPLWVVVAVSSIAFGLAHCYQGASGAFRAGMVGLVFGILYVVTGSIWIPILAHAMLDILQGAITHEILKKDDEQLEPQVA